MQACRRGVEGRRPSGAGGVRPRHRARSGAASGLGAPERSSTSRSERSARPGRSRNSREGHAHVRRARRGPSVSVPVVSPATACGAVPGAGARRPVRRTSTPHGRADDRACAPASSPRGGRARQIEPEAPGAGRSACRSSVTRVVHLAPGVGDAASRRRRTPCGRCARRGVRAGRVIGTWCAPRCWAPVSWSIVGERRAFAPCGARSPLGRRSDRRAARSGRVALAASLRIRAWPEAYRRAVRAGCSSAPGRTGRAGGYRRPVRRRGGGGWPYGRRRTSRAQGGMAGAAYGERGTSGGHRKTPGGYASVSFHLHLDLDRRVQRQDRDAARAAGVDALVAGHLAEVCARAVGDARLPGGPRRRRRSRRRSRRARRGPGPRRRA
ncbi:hypothetical protein STENM223S_00803 [Streptomyces tendae]